MLNSSTVKRIYAVYKLLIFLITYIIFLHTKYSFTSYYNAVFFTYFLDATLFFINENKYFKTVSLAVDIVFIYFIAKLLSIEEMVIFSVIPLFFSFLIIDNALSVSLFIVSFVVVFFYSDINIIFALISYAAAFVSSYLVNQSIKQKALIKKQREFDKEFKEKILIAKRLSLEFAHEIRNPLMGISGAIEILKKTQDEKVRKRMINIAQQEIERANNLTKDFLNLEKPYALSKNRLDMCIFIGKFASENKGLIDITVRCKEKPIPFVGDKEMIRRMLGNLMRNSMEAGASSINIEVSNDKNYVILIFEDNGTGIDLTNLDADKIFLPFFTTKEQGSGLGLAICKQIAESHSGSINIYKQNSFIIKLKGLDNVL